MPGNEKRYSCELSRLSYRQKFIIREASTHVEAHTQREQQKEHMKFSLVCEKCGRVFKKKIWFNDILRLVVQPKHRQPLSALRRRRLADSAASETITMTF